MTCLENLKQKTKSYRKPETSSIYLDRCLLVVFGIQNLLSHTLHTGPFCRHSPGSDENPIGAQNVYKFCKWRTYSSHRDQILLFWGQIFIFFQPFSTTSCGSPRTIFPRICSDNSTKFFSHFLHTILP